MSWSPWLYNPFAAPVFPAAPANNQNLAGRVSGSSYNTVLSPLDEMSYRNWVQQNNVPTDPDSTAPQDYDMRGFYKAGQQQNPMAQTGVNPNDHKLHFSDYWKTPLHQSFSSESQWANASTPAWINDSQQAAPNGRVVFDEQAQQAQRQDPFQGLLAAIVGQR